MTLEEQLKSAAIYEVMNPSFALTQQYLAANRLQFVDSVPFIEDIYIDNDNTEARVYFPVAGEKYYFVVYLDIGVEVTVRWMGMTAGNDIELRVISEDRSLNELLAILNAPPSRQWEKGQPRIIIGAIGKGSLYKNSGFVINLTQKKSGEVEEKLKSLLDYLMPFKDSLTQISKIATTEISVGYYGYKDEMWGVHLDHELLHALSELHLSIDIDLYASGPDLE